MYKMKKGFSLLLTLAMFFAILPMSVLTTSAAKSEYYTYEVSAGKATITDVDTSISGIVKLPSKLGGYPIAKIGDNAFSECSKLVSIELFVTVL